jgi:peptidase E
MKLVLCSEAFSTQDTIQACIDICDKPVDEISFAIINEAYAVEEDDKRWVLENLNFVANNFPGEIDMVNLLALSIEEVEARIRSKDVILVLGGHTDYLRSIFDQTGFTDLLPKLLESKVYVGSSAGSQILATRISDEAYKSIYGEENNYGTTNYLELVDFAIMPHLDSPNFENRRESLMEAVGTFDSRVYGLRDDSAVVVNGDEVFLVGSEPVIIG